MKRFEIHHVELRRPALALLGVLLLSAALVWASDAFRDSRERHLDTARSDLDTVRTDYRRAIEADNILRTSQQRYRELQQRGFIGDEPRLLWIESMRNSGRANRLYNLQYSLKQQRPLTLSDLDYTEYYQLYTSPMSVQLELTHEVDLIRFFAELDHERPAIYRLRGCTLKPMFEAESIAFDKANVAATCNISWYTVKRRSENTGDDSL
ncbi:MAG: hypothetical protein BMS9Abin09_0938 [Gammaproteobacteria bacterium]|nr:MAG: hypothetical protein BMS9Abin09_0938 [Gammaproteobacteria bacterium]